MLVVILIAGLSPGGDSSDRDNAAETTEQRTERTDTAAEAAEARAARAEAEQRRAAAARRERTRRARVRRARAARRREQAARQAQLAEEQRLAEEEQALREREALQDGAGQDCHPAYDPCLDPNASDYDCENGSEDGPEYTGLVTVKDSSDPYDLDRDGDGTGCD